MEELLYADESYAIRGAIFHVYREMGSGFLEKEIAPVPEAQLLNDLKATGMKLGLLVNFGSYPDAEFERRIL